MTNSGSASGTVSQANVSGSGLSVGGLSLPLTLTPGQKTSFSVVFAPASTGNITGSVSLVSNALNSPTTIALSGIGVQPLQPQDRKSTRLNSSHLVISYAVFCLKKKKT